MKYCRLLLLALALVTLMTACDPGTDPGTTQTTAGEEESLTVSLVTEGATLFTVLRSEISAKEETDAAVLLRKSINEKLGSDMGIGTDWVKRGEEPPTDTYEILVGQTNRPETADALAKLGGNQYIIKLYGENRLVLVGATPAGTKEAVDVFLSTYLSGEGTTLELPKDLETVADISYIVLEDLSMYKGSMKMTDLYGKLTEEEVKSFVGYVEANFTPAKNNMDSTNAMVYGDTGGTLEALNLVYKQTGYARALPVMCKIADAMMAARSDQPTGNGKTYTMGGVQPAWTNTKDSTFAGIGEGDIAGHVLFVAENILSTPSVWDTEVPDGDPYGYGKTYKERALKYVELGDQTMRDYFMKYLVNEEYKVFNDETKTHSGTQTNTTNKYFPWNQQFMLMGGFIHASACHKILGDDPALVAEYDKVVQTLVDFFTSQLQIKKVNGKECYQWYYWPVVSNYKNAAGQTFSQTGGKWEDANDAHMAYDVYGMHMCYVYGYQNITDDMMQRFCNTLNELVYDPDNAAGIFRGRVDGATGKADKNYVWPQVICLGIYDEESYKILFGAPGSGMANSIEKNIQRFGRVLYTKSIRYGITPEAEALDNR